jgi:DNA-binding winged helix-turn-helix (wHTH) protein/Tol biopolymer transport system component
MSRFAAMSESDRPSRIVRFGLFEANLETRELWKRGVRIPLQGQPFQVLAILLEHPAELVTREALREQVWPKDTFVDFDHALNTAITKIRLALGDDAEQPIFVETLPRRGYRFIGPLERADSGTNSADKSKRRLERLRLRKVLIALGVTLVVLLCCGIWSISRNVPTPKVIDSVQITKDGQHKDVTLKLLNDGSRLYFQEGSFTGPLSTVAPVFAANPSLVQVSTLGGETARIPVSLEEPLIYDLSPIRSEFLAGGQGNPFEHPLWVLPLPTGPPHRVGNIRALDACWSPDGNHLAYVGGNELFVASPDGTEIRKLATLDFPAYWIRYSPDGKRLRFTVFTLSGRPEDWNIMEIGADGSGLRQLPVHGCCGKWSADGNYYFYQTSRDIWVLPERRTFFGSIEGKPTQLTTGPIAFGAPTPSSDGKAVFVVGNQPRVEMVQYEANKKQFVPFLAGVSGGELEVSPDGQWVTYTTYPESNLWRSKLDGSERLQLTFPPVNAHEPRWSPDGKQILFTDVPRRMFIVPADGGILEQVMPRSELTPTEVGAGFWMPDADSIIFVMGSDKTPYAIYRLSLKTREVSKIPGSDGLLVARLSRNGRYLTGHGPNKTMLYDFESQRWSDFGEGIPAWSRDSKFVYLHRKNADQSAEIVRMRVPDGKVEPVLDLKGITLGGYWPEWVSLLADDSPVLMIDKSTQEIYRLEFQH